MNIVTSKFLCAFFVGSITLWYCVTPYIIRPHPDIAQDVLTKTKLAPQAPQADAKDERQSLVLVENWTKWRLYVNKSTEGEEAQKHSGVIYGNSKATIPLRHSAVLRMEWRGEYEIRVSRDGAGDGDGGRDGTSPSPLLVERWTPPSGRFGIYDHFLAEAGEAPPSVRVVPRFLFGLPPHAIAEMYGDDPADLPIVGVFSESPRFDRMVIHAYMLLVVLSVIFLLYANNPPEMFWQAKKRS